MAGKPVVEERLCQQPGCPCEAVSLSVGEHAVVWCERGHVSVVEPNVKPKLVHQFGARADFAVNAAAKQNAARIVAVDSPAPEGSRARTVNPNVWRETKLYFQVGTWMRGCAHCGSAKVFRANSPQDMGWWHYCWECSAFDQDCWPTEKSVWCKSDERRRRDIERAALLGDEKAFGELSATKQEILLTARKRANLAEKPFSEMTRDERMHLLIEQNNVQAEVRIRMSQSRSKSASASLADNERIKMIETILNRLAEIEAQESAAQ